MQLSELICRGHKPRAAHRPQKMLRQQLECWPQLQHHYQTLPGQSSCRWLPTRLELGQDKTWRLSHQEDALRQPKVKRKQGNDT